MLNMTISIYKSRSHQNQKHNNSSRTKRWMIELSPEAKETTRAYLLPRQARTLEIMQEKGEKGEEITKQDLLLEAGYSEYTARKPAQVFGSASFRALLDEIMPPEKLAEKHKELLDMRELKTIEFPSDMEDQDIADILKAAGSKLERVSTSDSSEKIAYFTIPIPKVILSALDMCYKVQGHYVAAKESEKPTIDLVALFNWAMAARRNQTLVLDCPQNRA